MSIKMMWLYVVIWFNFHTWKPRKRIPEGFQHLPVGLNSATPSRPNQPSSKFWIVEESRFLQTGARPRNWKPEKQHTTPGFSGVSRFWWISSRMMFLGQTMTTPSSSDVKNDTMTTTTFAFAFACVATQGSGAPRVPQDLRAAIILQDLGCHHLSSRHMDSKMIATIWGNEQNQCLVGGCSATPLKNICSSLGMIKKIPLWKKTHVPNHQPDWSPGDTVLFCSWSPKIRQAEETRASHKNVYAA